MTIIYFLIGTSIFMAICFLAAFFWSMFTGQNEDTYTPGVRILFDDEPLNQESDEDHFSAK